MTEQTDKQRLALIVAAKRSLRTEQRVKTWEERVQAIARMNVASKRAKASMARVEETPYQFASEPAYDFSPHLRKEI